VFQIGGAGAVGTGSIRGMPMLHRLHAAGLRIWPYDDSGAPTVVETYPRRLTGTVTKSSGAARARYVADHASSVEERHLELARASEDAFDALISALTMWEHVEELRVLPPPRDETMRLEGAIWYPGWDTASSPSSLHL
jgi:hypothetical protein